MNRRAAVAAVALGGALGAVARYGLALAWPHRAGTVPWQTLAVNVTGCLLLGALIALLEALTVAPRLARAFLGTGVLGGFTTFSTYLLDTRGLVVAGRPVAAAGYLVGTLAAALAATWLGSAAIRMITRSGGAR